MFSESEQKWRIFNRVFSRVGLRTYQHSYTLQTTGLCEYLYKYWNSAGQFWLDHRHLDGNSILSDRHTWNNHHKVKQDCEHGTGTRIWRSTICGAKSLPFSRLSSTVLGPTKPNFLWVMKHSFPGVEDVAACSWTLSSMQCREWWELYFYLEVVPVSKFILHCAHYCKLINTA